MATLGEYGVGTTKVKYVVAALNGNVILQSDDGLQFDSLDDVVRCLADIA